MSLPPAQREAEKLLGKGQRVGPLASLLIREAALPAYWGSSPATRAAAERIAGTRAELEALAAFHLKADDQQDDDEPADKTPRPTVRPELRSYLKAEFDRRARKRAAKEDQTEKEVDQTLARLARPAAHCAGCGAEFVPTRKGQIYAHGHDSCRQRATRKRKRDAGRKAAA